MSVGVIKLQKVFFGAFLAVSIFLACTTDYNPFQYHNANAHVASWPFDGSQTVGVFHTDTLIIVPTVHEKIDSICIQAQGNRFWEDSTWVPYRAESIDTLILPVSFYQSGKIDVVVRTYRSNGEDVIQYRTLHVESHLNPRDVTGQFGSGTPLHAEAVKDPDVLYHWDLGSGRLFETIRNEDSVLVFVGTSSGTGYVWVTDQLMKKKSPTHSFSYNFNDTLPPIIECVNDSLRGDTIISGDSLLIFRAFILDLNQGGLNLTTVNGEPFDSENFRQSIFIKRFSNISMYSYSSPMEIVVEAQDDPLFNNKARKTFYAVYDPTLPKTEGTDIEFIYPPDNASPALNNEMQIIGHAVDYTSSDIVLSLMVNDSVYPDSIVMDGNSSQWEQWSWDIRLTRLSNEVIITATDKSRGTITGRISRDIRYDATSIDNRDPVIWEITAENKPVHGLVVDSSHLLVSIISFDEGSGIRTLSVNGENLSPLEHEPYVWKHMLELAHSTGGNQINVGVTDKEGNRIDTTVTVFYNRKPYLATSPDFPKVFLVDSTYSLVFRVEDPDRDTVNVYPNPTDGKIQASDVFDNAIIWTPTQDDIGTDSLALVLDDGYPGKTFVTFPPFRVVRSLTAPPRNGIDRSGFPSFLQAGVDSLSVPLEVQPSTGQPPFRWSCTIGERVLMKDSTADSVIWSPGPQDTGRYEFRARVYDDLGQSDMFVEYITVVPSNQHAVSLEMEHDLPLTQDGALDFEGVTTSRFLHFHIRDNDHYLTERYALQISRQGITSYDTLDTARSFQLEIQPADSRALDTVIVRVMDRTYQSTQLYDSAYIRLSFAPQESTTISEISEIADIVAYMDAGRGVMTTFFGGVSSWTTRSGELSLAPKEGTSPGYYPTLDTQTNEFPVIVFSQERATNLQKADQSWEGSAFTIFAVVQFTSLTEGVRQVIVSSGGDNSFELGITCQGNIGIFNARSGGDCGSSSTVESELAVTTDKWYIISYRTEAGIYNGDIEVGVKRNGRAGTENLFLENADTGPAFMVGAADDMGLNAFLNAQMAELLYFERALTPEEMSAVEQNLSSKYTIPLE